jgi:putative ABC transport system permease protein
MAMWRHISRGVRSLLDGGAADRHVDEELQHFIDEAAAAYEADGMPAADAARAARRRVGNTLAVREEVRASGWEHVVETVAADLRYALRRLAGHPGFALVTIATLGLGIGSVTAMLSVAGPVLVRTLPFPQSDRIHAVWDQSPGGARVEMAFGSFLEVQERSRTLESMAVSRVWQPALSGPGFPERVEGRGVSVDYFRVFKVAPRLGRDFVPEDDRPNAPPVVMLSDRLWRRRFAADQEIIGRQITLDGSAYEVIGVMPAAFEHRLMPVSDVWRSLQYDRTLPSLQGREWGHHLRMVARLRDGVSRGDAVAELAQIARDPVERFARAPWAAMPQGLLVDSLHGDLTRESKPAMVAVLAAVGFLLLIACVNVVNLLLGRDAQRRAEFAMRTALGAGRARLIRQLLTETLLLAVLGGAAGLLVAFAFARALMRLGPQGLPGAAGVTLDMPLFLLAFAVTTIVGLLVGLIPAIGNSDLKGAMPQGTWQAASSRRLTRRSLVVAEIAFALVVLVGAALLFQSLRQLFAITPGFDQRNVLSVQVQVAGPRYADRAVIHRFFQDVLDAVHRVPGVERAALTGQVPLSGDSDVYGVQFAVNGTDPAASGGAFRYAVSPGYFETMGIPIRRGRGITADDRASAPLAVVISESLARSQFPDRDPIGERLHIGPTDRPWYTVVGVAGNVTQLSLETQWFDAVYVAPEQWHFGDRALSLVIKARGDASALTAAVRSAIWSVDKDQPIVRVSTLDDFVALTARERMFALRLFEAFGLAALLLTAIGVYGVVSSSVNERVREIGVRTALGASRPAILRMVMGEGASMAGLGIMLGAIAAAAASQGLTSLLFGVSRFDVTSYLAVALMLIAVTALACWLPARRAARIDPALTLRAE